jgi:uncharacterized membrane protein
MGGMWLFWALSIGAVILFTGWLTGAIRRPETEASAEEILKRRFAQGEISPDEFEERMQKLRGE